MKTSNTRAVKEKRYVKSLVKNVFCAPPEHQFKPNPMGDQPKLSVVGAPLKSTGESSHQHTHRDTQTI